MNIKNVTKKVLLMVCSIALVGGVFSSCKDNTEDIMANVNTQTSELNNLLDKQKAALEKLDQALEDSIDAVNSNIDDLHQELHDSIDALKNADAGLLNKINNNNKLIGDLQAELDSLADACPTYLWSDSLKTAYDLAAANAVLAAKNAADILDLQKKDEQIEQALVDSILAVKEYADSLHQAAKDYADDFGKHTTPDTAIKIKLIWDAIPSQIAKDNNKFIFSHVKEGARAKDLEDALEWLVSAGLVYKLNLVPTPQIPLESMKDNTYFKIYMADVGLLRKKSNVNYRTILNGDESFIQFKGAFSENYIMSELKCLGVSAYFWRTKADAEVDFISDYEGVLFPIEVKSATNTKAKSLQLFCKRFSPKLAFKASLKNVGDNMIEESHIWNIPLYIFFRIKEYIKTEMGW